MRCYQNCRQIIDESSLAGRIFGVPVIKSPAADARLNDDNTYVCIYINTIYINMYMYI